MRGRDTLPRRTILGLVGATATVATAGCLGEGEVDEAGESGLESEAAESGAANESIAMADWESVDEIRFETDVTVWQGIAPDVIEGDSNPTLVLVAGREYTIVWENTDGFRHNLELRDTNDDVVDGYETEPLATEAETQTLAFEASPAMAEYVCDPHEATMRGDLEIVEANG